MSCPDEIAEVVIEIMRVGVLRIRSLGWANDAKQCANEADHIHNLPALLSSYSDDLLRYYLDVERASYADSATGTQQFEPLWAKLEAIVRRNVTPTAAGK